MTDTSVTMNVGIEIGIQDKLQSEQKQKDFLFISLLNNLDRPHWLIRKQALPDTKREKTHHLNFRNSVVAFCTEPGNRTVKTKNLSKKKSIKGQVVQAFKIQDLKFLTIFPLF